MSKPRASPRKFSEKIALLERKEAEANAAFERIIKEVEETTRAPLQAPWHQNGTRISTSWLDVRYNPNDQTSNDNNTLTTNGFNHHSRHQQHLASFTCLNAPDAEPISQLSNDCQYLHQRANSFSFSNHDHNQSQQLHQPHHNSNSLLYHNQNQHQHQQQQPQHNGTNHNRHQHEPFQHHTPSGNLILPQHPHTAPPYLDGSSSRLAQVNVPNIEISPVADETTGFPRSNESTTDGCTYQQHQQQSNNPSQQQTYLTNQSQRQPTDIMTFSDHNECSIALPELGSISAARSLPDIANLRVVGEYSTSSGMIQRNNNCNPNHHTMDSQGVHNSPCSYDNNYNIISEDSTNAVLSAQGSYCSLNTSPTLSPRSQRNSLTRSSVTSPSSTRLQESSSRVQRIPNGYTVSTSPSLSCNLMASPRLSQSSQGLDTLGTHQTNFWPSTNFNNSFQEPTVSHLQSNVHGTSTGQVHDAIHQVHQQQILQQHNHQPQHHPNRVPYYNQAALDQLAYHHDELGQSEFSI